MDIVNGECEACPAIRIEAICPQLSKMECRLFSSMPAAKFPTYSVLEACRESEIEKYIQNGCRRSREYFRGWETLTKSSVIAIAWPSVVALWHLGRLTGLFGIQIAAGTRTKLVPEMADVT